MGECSLLPGFFGILVQISLFVLVCLVLVLKKKLEDRQRRRPWVVFGLDCSKQLLGAGWIHILNLICSTLLGGIYGSSAMGACEWYWINIVVDDTLGVYVEYLLLSRITWMLEHFLGNAAEDFRSGSYRHPTTGAFQPSRYGKQLAVWLIVVSLMKVAMLVLMVVFKHPLHSIASFVLGPVLESPTAELIVVMIITPLFMNALQCWVVDGFIRERCEVREDLGEGHLRGESSVQTSSLWGSGARRQELLGPPLPAPGPQVSTWPPGPPASRALPPSPAASA